MGSGGGYFKLPRKHRDQGIAQVACYNVRLGWQFSQVLE